VILVVFAAWALCEAVAWAVLTLLKPPVADDSLRLYRPHPYRVYTLIPGARSQTGRISINSHGFRGPEIELHKPTDTVRIACLGDSTTFGDTATTDGHTYPAHLERLLREHYAKSGGRPSRIEVINAGVPGYTTLEALIYFETKLLDYQLDAAVFDLGVHDGLFMADFREFASDYTHARKILEIPSPHLWERSALLSLLLPRRRSVANPYRCNQEGALEQLTTRNPDRLKVDETEQRRCFRPERIAIFERNVRNFVYVARGQDVVPVLATITYSPQAGFLAEVIGQINESIRKTANALSVPCVDLAREMPWSAEAFEDASRPRDCPEGLERMARVVADVVIRQRIVEQAVAREGGGNLRR
jgi:lysophospholipase L1-like esterase